jgi:hypothetical protein
VDATAIIFREAPVTDAIVKRTAVTIINQCHVRRYNEKFFPFTYNTHSPNITKLMKTSQYVPYNTHSPHITKLMKTSQYVSYNTHSSHITNLMKISQHVIPWSSLVKLVFYYNSLMLQSTHFHHVGWRSMHPTRQKVIIHLVPPPPFPKKKILNPKTSYCGTTFVPEFC